MAFDALIHQPTRLKIMAFLSGLPAESRVEFSGLRKELGLTEGNLSRHLSRLEEAGYVKTEKVFEKRKPKTWIRLTSKGRYALEEHLRALQELISQTRSGES